jgi:hypothetical protein
MIDLAGVCRRHGVETLQQGGGKAWMARFAAEPLPLPVVWHSTKEAAVCALLKARYSIGTGTPCAGGGAKQPPAWMAAWWEKGNAAATIKSELADSELAAVVALADRLAGAQP